MDEDFFLFKKAKILNIDLVWKNIILPKKIIIYIYDSWSNLE